MDLDERLKELSKEYHIKITIQGKKEIDGTAGYYIFKQCTDPQFVEEYVAKYNYNKQINEKIYKRK